MGKIGWSILRHAILLFLVNCIGWGVMNDAYVNMNLHVKRMVDWETETYDQEATNQVH